MNRYRDFWKVIDKLNWNKLSKRTNSIEAYKDSVFGMFYKNAFSPEDVYELNSLVRLYASALRERVEQYSVENYGDRFIYPNNSGVISVSDDTFWDLCCHIVGLGKEAFEHVFNNPSEIVNYPEFKEGFWYCFNDSDYAEYFNNAIDNVYGNSPKNKEELIDEINDILSYCVDISLDKRYGYDSDLKYLEKSKKDVERLIKKYLSNCGK